MYRTFPWFHGEGFELLLKDLRALPADRVTVVEGFRLLPQLLAPLLTDRHAAVWLIPTEVFRRAAFAARAEAEAFWLRTSDPERAFGNLLARDALFTTEVAAAAAQANLTRLVVDGARDAEILAARVASRFGL